jgi:NADPH:quinone reductase-like Zn-dependent oxidoreductase
MKVVIFNRYGDSNELQLLEIKGPHIKSKQVLVKIQAAGINPIDWKIRKGYLDIWAGYRLPKIPGIEAAGEITETGKNAKTFKVGEKVIVYTGIKGGAYAEYYAAYENQLYYLPVGLNYFEAAATSVAGLTALQTIRDIAYVNSDTSILVNGASGGIGTFAVQIAKIFNGHVTAVCSAGNTELVKKLGADETIDYKKTDLLAEGNKYDAVFDTVGNLKFTDLKNILNKGGVLITTSPDPAYFMRLIYNNLTSSRKLKFVNVKIDPDDMKWLQVEFELGKLKVHIDRVYSLKEAKEAHDYSESGRVRGKIVISMNI